MIIRCAERKAFSRAFTRCREVAVPPRAPMRGHQTRYAQYSTARIHRGRAYASQGDQFEIFKRLKYPDHDERKDPSVWTALLESGLPSQLRQLEHSQRDPSVDAHGLAQILIAAQHVSDHLHQDWEGIDVLFHLGMNERRWDSVIWLVKRLVEAFGGSGLHKQSQPRNVFPWSSEQSLEDLTNNKLNLSHIVDTSKFPESVHTASTLDELTQDAESDSQRLQLLRRAGLGQVWRSLGHMTMACADEGMKPEVLEIIAYLHHMGVMPLSIYNQRPSADSTAIQQPLTLRLFSSRILTSLSDAAWRAHEKVVVEEAKAKGAGYASLRPEIPGMAYRVHVAGLRPEIWMELILWSCLHGGWVVDGLMILRKMCMEPTGREWRPLSFRSLIPMDESGDDDWDRFDYIFNTQAHAEITRPGVKSIVQIRRTISSEAVNAYIDAVLSIMKPDLENEGISLTKALRHLTFMKKLLDRSALSLSTGTWDAILVRFFDLHPHVIDRTDHFKRLISLSPIMGQELSSENGRSLPDYVMDGSAAVLGLFHRALLLRIRAGDVEGAFRFFQALQDRADSNKNQSILDFIRKQQISEHQAGHAETELFTSHFPGIEYPAFDLQIPATTLGPFLDLIADAKAYEFGKWLLHSRDLDGPVIPEGLYGDPALEPVLIRFAAETGDTTLLDKLVNAHSLARPYPKLPGSVLRSFLDSQINLKRWDAAERILQHMEQQSIHCNILNFAHLVRMMLSDLRSPTSDQSGSDFERARDLFGEMASGKYSRAWDENSGQFATLITIVASLNRYWGDYCVKLDCLPRHYFYDLPTKAFNLALGGVVVAYGSIEGRKVLGRFWTHRIRDAQRAEKTQFDDAANDHNGAYQPFKPRLYAKKHYRTQIYIPSGPRFKKIAMHGGVEPDLMTIRIIFRKALDEFRQENSPREPIQQSHASAADLVHESSDQEASKWRRLDMIKWAVKRMYDMHMANDDIVAELATTLEEHEMQAIKSDLPAVFEEVDQADDD